MQRKLSISFYDHMSKSITDREVETARRFAFLSVQLESVKDPYRSDGGNISEPEA